MPAAVQADPAGRQTVDGKPRVCRRLRCPLESSECWRVEQSFTWIHKVLEKSWTHEGEAPEARNNVSPGRKPWVAEQRGAEPRSGDTTSTEGRSKCGFLGVSPRWGSSFFMPTQALRPGLNTSAPSALALRGSAFLLGFMNNPSSGLLLLLVS
jgi:hypothetical protein